MRIKNAADTPLTANTGTVPDMSGALLNWFQPMIFGIVTKATVAFQVQETVENVSFMGVWQPFSDRQLMLKPEGQRSFSWFWLHSDPSLNLHVDSVVEYLGVQYRIMSKRNYSLYQYIEYHLIQDYSGSGPVAP